MKRFSLLAFIFMLIVAMSSIVLAADYDFDGRTVRVQGHHMREERLFDNPEWAAHLEDIQSEFNVKLEFLDVRVGDTADYIRESVIAGDADGLWILSAGEGVELALDGFLLPLEGFESETTYWDTILDPEVLEVRGTKFFFAPLADKTVEILNPDVPFWGVPFFGIYWNKTLFEEQGLPDLQEIYERGDWNWDTFLEVAIDGTRDTTGDGEIDQYGFVSHNWWGIQEKDWFVVNNAPLIRDEDGRMVYGLDHPAAIETWEFLNEMHELGVASTQHGRWGFNAFVDEEAVMVSTNPWGASGFPNQEFDYGFVPMPKGPSAEEYVAPSYQIWRWAIPVTTREDPEALMALHSALFMTSDDAYPFDQIDEELFNSFGMRVNDMETLENLLFAQRNLAIEMEEENNYFGFGLREVMNEILDGAGIAATVDSYREAAQMRLDDVFNQ
ncbi:ABC transporter substrate-binding protein [Natronospora cellulosivora (SeqCode)]